MNSKRIAKNSLMLYFRMFFTMLVSLYTSRIILKILGVEDFGLYNVVGGIVFMFGFINMSMTTATSRFINYELGKIEKSLESLRIVFSTTLYVHLIIALIVVVLCETIGLYLLYTKMQIPNGRFIAAIWVFQSSIISIFLTILIAPYNATIIANEKMSVFAFISIVEVMFKLIIVFLLPIFNFDRLITYAVLYFIVTLILQSIYVAYCLKSFKECAKVVKYDKELFKQVFKFASWNLLGDGAYATFSQGVNILLNIFFGPVINAARGIAMQINGIALRFTSSFQTAINPQIIKSYSSGNIDDTHKLIMMSSRFTLYLLAIIAIPIFFNIEFILNLWLKDVPDYTPIFVKLMIMITLFDALGNPMTMAINATGDNKIYQIFIGGIMLLIFPIAFISLKMGYKPQIVFIIHLFIGILAHIARIILVKNKIKFSLRNYMIEIFIKGGLILIFAGVIAFLIQKHTESHIFSLLFDIIVTALIIFIGGLSKIERRLIIKKIIHK